MPKKRPQTDAEDSTKKPKTSDFSDSSFVYGGTTTTTTSPLTAGHAASRTALPYPPPQVWAPLTECTVDSLKLELAEAKKELESAEVKLEKAEVKLEKAKKELAEAESRDSPNTREQAQENSKGILEEVKSARSALLTKQAIVEMLERRRTLTSILAKLTYIHQSSHQHA